LSVKDRTVSLEDLAIGAVFGGIVSPGIALWGSYCITRLDKERVREGEWILGLGFTLLLLVAAGMRFVHGFVFIPPHRSPLFLLDGLVSLFTLSCAFGVGGCVGKFIQVRLGRERRNARGTVE
jgi:hypothetical protein